MNKHDLIGNLTVLVNSLKTIENRLREIIKKLEADVIAEDRIEKLEKDYLNLLNRVNILATQMERVLEKKVMLEKKVKEIEEKIGG